MKINGSQDVVIERDGLSSNGAFTMQFNAKMARILSDGLYSDKIQSIIRELSANAVDSHVESGQPNRPIEVHLPTVFEPFFHVRDFGIGLNHQQVIDIFTCYGASTKTNSNAFIGQLGLGSKSPFSYVDAFDVTARQDGVERQYSMYKDEKGMPSVALLGEQPTKEGNGVTVKMPVKQANIREFAEKARLVFKWFDVKPEITGVTDFVLNQQSYAYQGAGWKICSKSNNNYNYYDYQKPVALMGRVAYPIDKNSIQNLSNAQRSLLSLPLVLDFAIGDLEIAASRESLGYDPRTQTAISVRLDQVLKELAIEFERRIAAAKTEWEARKIYANIFGSEGQYRYELEQIFGTKGLQWRKMSIVDSRVSINSIDVWPEKQYSKPVFYSLDSSYKRPRQVWHGKIHIPCSDSSVIIYDDLNVGGQSRMSYYSEQNPDKNIYMFGPTSEKTWDQITEMLGSPTVMFTSAMPKKPTAARTKINMRLYNGDGSGPKAWDAAEVTLEEGGFYVLLEQWDVKDGERYVSDLEDIVRLAKSLKIFDQHVAIYTPRGHWRSKVVDSEDWINVFDYIREKLSTMLTPSAIQSIADKQELESVKAILPDAELLTVTWKLKNLNGAMAKWLDGMGKLIDSAEVGKANAGLQNLAQRFGHTITQVPPSVNAQALWTGVKATYPMMTIALGGYGKKLTSHTVPAVTDYINMVDSVNQQAIEKSAEELLVA